MSFRPARQPLDDRPGIPRSVSGNFWLWDSVQPGPWRPWKGAFQPVRLRPSGSI